MARTVPAEPPDPNPSQGSPRVLGVGGRSLLLGIAVGARQHGFERGGEVGAVVVIFRDLS